MITAARARLDRLDRVVITTTPPEPDKGINWDGNAASFKARLRLRDTAADLIPDEAVYCCGKRVIFAREEENRYVTIRAGETGSDVSGVVSCKSVWLCPVCAAKIAGERRRQIRRVMIKHIRAGGSVYMATFTVKHAWKDDPKPMREALSKAWTKLISGKPWQKNRDRLGVVGYVKSLEVTHGPNGWHPHIHALIFIKKGSQRRAQEAFGDWLYARWAEKVEALGYGGCDPKAWRFERAECEIEAGDYVLKGALDFEVTHAHTKKAAGGHRSPMQILADVSQYNRGRDKFLFRAYAAAFKGARQLTFSRGFLALYGEDDLTDDEAIDRSEQEMKPVARLHADAFALIVRKGLLVEMLDVAMVGHLALLCWLVNHGVGLYQIRPPPDEGEIYA